MEDTKIVFDLPWLESVTMAEFLAITRKVKQGSEELAQLNALLRTPEGKAIADDMLNDPDYVPKPRQAAPTPEEAAQIAADTALAEQQATEAAAAQTADGLAEAARKAAEVAPVPEPVVEKKKIVVDYQVTSEDGSTSIGRRTHIEGWSNEEVIEKLKAAHINAVRYAERIKKNQVQSVEGLTQQRQVQLNAEQSEKEANEAVVEATKDPAKLPEAIRKVSKADREAEVARQEARARGIAVANAWMADHKEDFLPCDANTKIIGDWLKENNLVLSYENLELAFTATETRLAKPVHQAPVEEVSAVAVVNPPAAAPAAPVAPAPSITAPAAVVAVPVSTPVTQPSQAAVAAPETTPAAAPIAQPAARRPGVNGGIAPGSLSAQRPQPQQPSPTANRAELLKEMKNPAFNLRKALKNPEYVRKLRAAGIPVASDIA